MGYVWTGGVASTMSTGATWAQSVLGKMVLSVKNGSQFSLFSSGSPATATSALPVGPMTNLRIGSDSGPLNFFNAVAVAANTPLASTPTATPTATVEPIIASTGALERASTTKARKVEAPHSSTDSRIAARSAAACGRGVQNIA